MTEKRFYMDKSGDLYDKENGLLMLDFGYSYDGVNCKKIIDLLNELHDENEQLKKELLFFYDVANCECSTNWKEDMEKGCKRFFNCTYEEAKEKYGDYDGMWWELNE